MNTHQMFYIYEVPKTHRECGGQRPCKNHRWHYESKDWKLLSKHYDQYAAVKALTKYQHNTVDHRLPGSIEVHLVDKGRGPFGVLVSLTTRYGKTVSFEDCYPNAI
jgi:hypothetical protein